MWASYRHLPTSLMTQVRRKDVAQQHQPYAIRACNLHSPYEYSTMPFPACTTIVCSIFTTSYEVAVQASRELKTHLQSL